MSEQPGEQVKHAGEHANPGREKMERPSRAPDRWPKRRGMGNRSARELPRHPFRPNKDEGEPRDGNPADDEREKLRVWIQCVTRTRQNAAKNPQCLSVGLGVLEGKRTPPTLVRRT